MIDGFEDEEALAVRSGEKESTFAGGYEKEESSGGNKKKEALACRYEKEKALTGWVGSN